MAAFYWPPGSRMGNRNMAFTDGGREEINQKKERLLYMHILCAAARTLGGWAWIVGIVILLDALDGPLVPMAFLLAASNRLRVGRWF